MNIPKIITVTLSIILVLLTSLPVHAAIATLSWTPPTTNANGTPLTDLAGYRIYYGTVSRGYSQSVDVSNVTSYIIGGFAEGQTYYFAVTAYDTYGNESAYSLETSKTFPVLTSPTRMTNIATRALVQTGSNVEIGGFIIGGTDPKTVLIRGRGPSMGGAPFNIPGTLANPTLQLYSFAAGAFIAQNDDWQTTDSLCGSPAIFCGNVTQIQATGKDPCQPNPGQTTAPPGCYLESAIYITLLPGNYGAIVSGVNSGTGAGLVEIFEVDNPTTELINIATRSLVQTGANVEIAGFIIGGNVPKQVLIRGRGPSMAGAPFNYSGTLANPMMQIYSFATQTYIAQNNDWQVGDPLCGSNGYVCGGANEIIATGLDPCQPNPGQTVAPPGCSQESAILITLPPGNYSAVVSGVGGTVGVGLVEVFGIQ